MNERHRVYQLMEMWFEEAAIAPKAQLIMEHFLSRYHETVVKSGRSKELAAELFSTYLELIRGLNKNPIAFEPYHAMLTKPVNYYQFGIDFASPLVNENVSECLGIENLAKIVFI